MGAGAGESANLPQSVVIELRRTAADLLGSVSSYADEMLDYVLERVPEAGADDDLRGLTLGSCSPNLEAALSMVRHGIDVSAATAPVLSRWKPTTCSPASRTRPRRPFTVDHDA